MSYRLAVLLLCAFCALALSWSQPGSHAVAMTSTQLSWLAKHRVLRVGAIPDLAPVSSYAYNNKPQGLGVAYAEWALRQLGVRIEWVPLPESWPKLGEALQAKELDLVVAVPSQAPGLGAVLFSQPFLKFPMVIVVQAKADAIHDFDALNNMRVATIRNSFWEPLGTGALPQSIKNRPYASIADALQGLSRGEVDAYVDLMPMVSHAVQQQDGAAFKIGAVPGQETFFSMAIRPDWPELRDMVNQMLAQRPDTLDATFSERWVRVHYEHSYSWYRTVAVASAVAAIGVAIVLLLLRWNKKLQDKVQRLRLTEERLSKNQRESASFLRIIDEDVYYTRTDPFGVVTYVSSAYCHFLGWGQSELLGQTFHMIRHPDTPNSIYEEMWRNLHDGKPWSGELKNRKRNGDTFWVTLKITPILEGDEITEFQATLTDITDRKKLEALAITDALTGLHNRRHFNDVYPRELRRARREGTSLLMCILDVDYFKKYNDNYGHAQGDFVLQALGEVLSRYLRRPSDYAFRLGGEEFGIMTSGHTLEESRLFLESILQAIRDLRITHAQNPPGVATASMGALLIIQPDPGLERQYYQRADALLYRAKEQGRNRLDIALSEQTPIA